MSRRQTTPSEQLQQPTTNRTETWRRPYAPYRPNDALNETDSWRFRFPEFHVQLYLWSPEVVGCRSCQRNPVVHGGSYAAVEITDQVSDRTLDDFIEEDPLI